MKNFLLAFFISFFAIQASAIESDWQNTSERKEGSIRLITAGFDNNGNILFALHIKFTDNWKTYWKHPGDSGLAITPNFEGSQNIKSSQMLWPVPERHSFFGLEGWGYGKEIIMPIISEVSDKAKPAKLFVDVKWAVCDENCIFVDNKLEVEVPINFKNQENYNLIKQYLKQVPKQISQNSKVKLESLKASDKAIVAEFSSEKPFAEKIDLFIIEPSKNFRFPQPGISLSPDGKKLTIQTNYEILLKGKTLENKTLNLTLVNGKTGYELDYKITKLLLHSQVDKLQILPSSKNADNSVALAQVTLLQAIIAAVIGGLILNIMPCVLPVLMLKIFGVIKHSASDKPYIRKTFSFTVLGIITSFLLLAIFVVILKSLGHTVGWGIQFQQPAFLIFLSCLLTLFAANQFGWFEVPLPQKLSGKLNNALDSAGNSTPLGNFLTGAFATLLATPCTAPFLITAVSFAFAASYLEIFIIFFFMGVGLSIPYLLIMLSPSLVKIFPKPGNWMKYVKIVLGLFLFATNIWIFTIFHNSKAGVTASFLLIFCQILLLIWLFASNKLKLDKLRTMFATLYMICATFGVVLYLSSIEREPEFMKDEWVVFSESEITNLVNQGRVVYVDVTAEWCLTCQFNKANVIYPMKAYLDEQNVILMKADYTSPSREISIYLGKNKAYGIPFNKVYGPNAKDGIVLPVILKENDVKAAIEKAK
jgi:suppressor for copper-sensitivity B